MTTLSASAPLDTHTSGPVTDASGRRTDGTLAGTWATGTAEQQARQQPESRLALSFEVMPPRSAEQQERSGELLDLLASYDPDYVAVTSAVRTGWSAGTAAFISQLSATTRLRPLAHLACTAAPRDELVTWIERYIDSGVRGFLAIRGDLAPGATAPPSGHLAHADALVTLLRSVERNQVARLCAGRFAIGVAAYPSGHPESKRPEEDIDVLAAKQRNGADFAITQLFFNAAQITTMSRRADLAGVTLPIIPGIMPITGSARLKRMCHLSGLTPPAYIAQALATAGSPAEEYEIGLNLTADFVEALVAVGVPGLHFYTFNDPTTITELLSRLSPQTRARLTNNRKDTP